MRIGQLATRLGTSPDALRFYERRGLLPTPARKANGYREYTDGDVERLRLLIGLRQLDLPLAQAAELSSLCAEGRCDEVSQELRHAVAEKRLGLRRRIDELHYLDRRLAHLEGDLAAGRPPRPLITARKEGT
jgi:DNA-binding transcriptional MerR regulator